MTTILRDGPIGVGSGGSSDGGGSILDQLGDALERPVRDFLRDLQLIGEGAVAGAQAGSRAGSTELGGLQGIPLVGWALFAVLLLAGAYWLGRNS